jgi:hypothetical protein
MFSELQDKVHGIAHWYSTEGKNPEIDPNMLVRAEVTLTSLIATIAHQEVVAKRQATQTKLDYEFEHYTTVGRVKKELECSNAEAERTSELQTFAMKRKYKEAEDDHHAWKQLYMSSKLMWENFRSHLSFIKNQLGNE